MERTYIGIAHKAKGSGYWLDFPDAPGCLTEGETLSELAKNAKEALEGWIETVVETGRKIPEPCSGEIKLKREDILLAVSVEVANQSVRLNITLPKNLLSRIDAFVAKDSKFNRSSFLADAARKYMNGRPAHSRQ